MDVLLQGRDFDQMGHVEVVAAAADLALGITRGFHPKPYAYVDPNEDVVAVIREGRVTALAVADGHNGHEGSHAVVDGLLEVLPQPLPEALGRRQLVECFAAANDHLRAVRAQLSGPNRGSRTTLALAYVAPTPEGGRTLVSAGVGDSAVLVCSGGAVRAVTRDRHRFMGDRMSLPEMAAAMDVVTTDLDPDDTVVVVSDGYTNFADVHATAGRIAGVPADQAVRRLMDAAQEGGAGDNVAVAVLTPAVPAPPTQTPGATDG